MLGLRRVLLPFLLSVIVPSAIGCASSQQKTQEERRTKQAEKYEDVSFDERTIAAGSPEQEFLMQLIRLSAREGMLGEGQVASVYPFACDDRFVLKVPKTKEQIIQRLRKQKDTLKARRKEAERLQSLQWRSYVLGAERGGGIIAPVRLYKFEGDTPFPYLIVQERAAKIVKSHLKQLVMQGETKKAKELLNQNLQLRRTSLERGFWEVVDNFTVNNGLLKRDGELVQRIIDAGEMRAEPPKPGMLVRTSQTSVTEHLSAWSPELAAWYEKRSKEMFGDFTTEKISRIWNSAEPKPIEYEEVPRALEKIARAGGPSTCSRGK